MILTTEQIQAVLDGVKEILTLRQEVEILRMQLVACGVVAMANTPESAKKARAMHPEYMSPSCQDVMEAVDREIAHRVKMNRQAKLIKKQKKKIAKLSATAERLREAYTAGFISACNWPEPYPCDVGSPAFQKELNVKYPRGKE